MTSEEIIDKLKTDLGGKIKAIGATTPQRVWLEVDPADILEVTRVVHQDHGTRFNIASGMEMEKGFEILYHFAYEHTGRDGVLASVRVVLGKEHPAVASITPSVPAAEWIEREMHELLGIEFRNHPDMRPLLLAEDWPKDVHPLRRGRPWEGKVDLRI